jgi:hypothetical protein
VNKSLGKEEFSHEDALKHWTEISTNNKNSFGINHYTKEKFCNFAMSKINYILILCIFIIIVLLVFVIKKL